MRNSQHEEFVTSVNSKRNISRIACDVLRCALKMHSPDKNFMAYDAIWLRFRLKLSSLEVLEAH